MTQSLRWPIIALLVALASQASSADLPPALAGFPNTKVRYYAVHGRTGRDIIADLNARAPRDAGGSRVGYTDWHLEPMWRERTDGRSCTVTDPVIRFSATVTLPRLADPELLSLSNRQNWDIFAAAVARHEAGHVRIALDHIDDVRAAILNSRCGSTSARVQRVVDGIESLQIEYDRVTNHGIKQGSVLRVID